MNQLTREQSIELDILFQFLFGRGNLGMDDNFISTKTEIDESHIQNQINHICKISDSEDLSLLVFEEASSGRCEIVSFNKFETKRFIKNGGFEKLHKKEAKKNFIKRIKQPTLSYILIFIGGVILYIAQELMKIAFF